jgi:hypothetical protein
MTSPDLFFARQLMEMRVDEALRKAERERWLREAGVHRTGRLSRRYCWLLCQLGRLLVSLGKSLQRRYRVPIITMEEHVAWGSE